MAPLTSISDRLTPSVPIEITFAAQPVATGKKQTTIIGHVAASGSSAIPYSTYDVINVGDYDAAKAEVDAIAGAGSQLGKMVYAFIAANAKAGRSNFPAVRVCFLKNSDNGFGTADEAIDTLKLIRSDMIVSCYPASSSTNRGKILDLVNLISGVDRDLSGQFGSFATFGSIDALAAAQAYGINSNKAIVAYLQDTNTAAIADLEGDTVLNSDVISNISDTTGVNEGAQISGAGIPAGALVGSKTLHSISMVDASGAPVLATAAGTNVLIDYQNVISQEAEIVAAAHAGAMMGFGFPYIPLQGVEIGGLIPSKKSSDRIEINPNGSSEACLVAGLSPLYVQPGNKIGFIRTRTTWTLKPDNVTPITDYFDWQQLVVLNDFREDCYLISQNPPFNNNPGGAKASRQIAAQLKDEILNRAYYYEQNQAFQNVKELAKEFLVQPSQTSRGRFDFKIPVDAIPGLYVIAGNIQAVSSLTSFTL
jgi:hypothetical protein